MGGHEFECMPCVYGCPLRAEEGIEFPGARVIGGYKLPKMNPENSAPLQEQQVLLTTEDSPQPCKFSVNRVRIVFTL